ncbi:response regulator [Silanimonas sp.]|jgi:DNA-binding NarL/FixJ family response regulator|uniref:response regulator n=1 Tax=Silanimonas sp. TaxID=1929290 RepID=UPI0037CB866D
MNRPEATRIRLALADDQALVLKGLSALLVDLGFEVALESPDAERLIAALPQRPVDVIVSDIRMPGLGGIGLIRALRESGDATPVILLTTFDDSALMLAAIEAGAQGFLLKDAAPEDLHDAIDRVARGETLLQPVSLGPVRALLPAERNAGQPHLTEREASILKLVAGGYSNKEIGRVLHLSEGTVKNYISDLLVKLDCRDRTHAVMKAISQRLL